MSFGTQASTGIKNGVPGIPRNSSERTEPVGKSFKQMAEELDARARGRTAGETAGGAAGAPGEDQPVWLDRAVRSQGRDS